MLKRLQKVVGARAAGPAGNSDGSGYLFIGEVSGIDVGFPVRNKGDGVTGATGSFNSHPTISIGVAEHLPPEGQVEFDLLFTGRQAECDAARLFALFQRQHQAWMRGRTSPDGAPEAKSPMPSAQECVAAARVIKCGIP